MGMFLTIRTERPILNLKDGFDGKPLAHTFTELDPLAEQLGLTPIGHLISGTPEEKAELMGLDPNEDADPDYVQTDWYDPADALRTVEGLQSHLRAHPEELTKIDEFFGPYIPEDLEEAAKVLRAATQEGVRIYFHLVL